MESRRINRHPFRLDNSRNYLAILLRRKFQRLSEYCRHFRDHLGLHRDNGRHMGSLGHETRNLVGAKKK